MPGPRDLTKTSIKLLRKKSGKLTDKLLNLNTEDRASDDSIKELVDDITVGMSLLDDLTIIRDQNYHDYYIAAQHLGSRECPKKARRHYRECRESYREVTLIYSKHLYEIVDVLDGYYSLFSEQSSLYVCVELNQIRADMIATHKKIGKAVLDWDSLVDECRYSEELSLKAYIDAKRLEYLQTHYELKHQAEESHPHLIRRQSSSVLALKSFFSRSNQSSLRAKDKAQAIARVRSERLSRSLPATPVSSPVKVAFRRETSV